MMKRRLSITVGVFLALTVLLLSLTAGALAAPQKSLVVEPYTTEVIDETITLSKLVIGEGAYLVAPDGYSLTLTVNGVETGQAMAKLGGASPDFAITSGLDTAFLPGTYLGKIVLTVAEENLVPYAQGGGPPGSPPPPPLYFPFRQALYFDDGGLVEEKSVLAAVVGKKLTESSIIKNILIRSTGECFDGIYVADGRYTFTNPKIRLTGNGRSDFVGYGAAVVGSGEGTTLVLDGAEIMTTGVARAGVVADKGANVIVKNSRIQTNNGVMPADYMPTIDTTQMRSVPWMLGLSGNVRATNLLGTNTKASYINSYIGSEGWGVLSTDGCTTPILTAINSTIAITGEDGYGSYGIGDATEYFYGCTFNVATYSTISRGSYLFYGDSDAATVKKLNDDLDLGLTSKELKQLKPRKTVVNSERFGVMWHGGGTLDISGGTIFNTKETTLLDKGQAIEVTVDGSKGAKLLPKNGVIMQLMDDDDPGPQPPFMYNTGIYSDPGVPATPDGSHNVTTFDGSDAVATFSNIKLNGDFYNSTQGGLKAGPFGPPSSASKNLALSFEDATVTGMITASTAVHLKSPLEFPVGWDVSAPYVNVGHEYDYKYLGKVVNTPAAAINNGVIVSLEDSKWVVKGTCYLTSLTIDEDSDIVGLMGADVAVYDDGTLLAEVMPGVTYTGNIVVTVALP